MGALREFFTPQIFINSLVFAFPVSLLILWRAAYVGDVDFLSMEAVQLYFTLVLTFSVLFIFFFFILFLLGRRKPQDDDD